MKTTTYGCDWCRRSRTKEQMHSLYVCDVDSFTATRLHQEICDECLGRLKDAIGQIRETTPGESR